VLGGLTAKGLLTNDLALAVSLWLLAAAVAAYSLTRWVKERHNFVARSDPRRDLVVTVARERFTAFHHRAVIVEIKVLVFNNTVRASEPRSLDLIRFSFSNLQPFSFELLKDDEVRTEVNRIRAPRQRISGIVDPGETVVGYWVEAFPVRPEGGKPGYQIAVEDAADEEYEVEVQRRPKQAITP
ncbi:MAG: hypothetical protein WBF51_07745, partial [Candidatus Dormiibacterota bacterium]